MTTKLTRHTFISTVILALTVLATLTSFQRTAGQFQAGTYIQTTDCYTANINFKKNTEFILKRKGHNDCGKEMNKTYTGNWQVHKDTLLLSVTIPNIGLKRFIIKKDSLVDIDEAVERFYWNYWGGFSLKKK